MEDSMTSHKPIDAARMRYVDQAEYCDIAERFGVSMPEARKLVSQGLPQLREEFGQAPTK